MEYKGKINYYIHNGSVNKDYTGDKKIPYSRDGKKRMLFDSFDEAHDVFSVINLPHEKLSIERSFMFTDEELEIFIDNIKKGNPLSYQEIIKDFNKKYK